MGKKGLQGNSNRDNDLISKDGKDFGDKTKKLKSFVGEYLEATVEEFKTRMSKLDDKTYTERWSKLYAFDVEMEQRSVTKTTNNINIENVGSMTWTLTPVSPKKEDDTLIDITPKKDEDDIIE